MKSLMIGMVAAFAISLLASEAGAENSNSKTINADKAAASSFIAPYLDKPTPFPVVTPLAKSARGKKIAVMDCGTPICALLISADDACGCDNRHRDRSHPDWLWRG